MPNPPYKNNEDPDPVANGVVIGLLIAIGGNVKGGVKVYQRGGAIVYHTSQDLAVEYQVLRRFSLSIPR